MIQLTGRTSSDRGPRLLLFLPQHDGETYLEIANPPKTSGHKMLVPTAELLGLAEREAQRVQQGMGFLTLDIQGHSATGAPAQLTVKATDDPGIVGVYCRQVEQTAPSGEWEDKGFGRKKVSQTKDGGWAIRLPIREWRRGLRELRNAAPHGSRATCIAQARTGLRARNGATQDNVPNKALQQTGAAIPVLERCRWSRREKGAEQTTAADRAAIPVSLRCRPSRRPGG
jgi:hypothetical protein